MGQLDKGRVKTRDRAINDTVADLKESQAQEGSWSKAANLGMMGVVLTSLLKSAKVAADDPTVSRAKYQETHHESPHE